MTVARPESAVRRTGESVRRLARVLARHCNGPTALFGRPWAGLEREFRRRGVDLRVVAEDVPTEEAPGTPVPRFRTVVLARCLEYRSPGDHAALVDRSWHRVCPDGRLVVSVPNDGAVDDPDAVARFRRHDLKRLLQRIDRPRVIRAQPYGWLAMYVDERPRLDRLTSERHEAIARLCRGRVIELGCGYGHLCDAIAQRGLPVTGVDRSRLKIDRGRALFTDIRFEVADLLTLPTTNHYDTVVLAEVLEHVPPDVGDRMLARAWSLLAEGGRLIVSVPNEDCVPHPNHLREFSREDLAQMLRRFGRPRTVTDQPFKWLLMHVER